MKLKEIIDFNVVEENKVWSIKNIREIECKYNLKLLNEYIYFLQFYGNNYIKDNYCFKPPISSSYIAKQDNYELDGIFGLYKNSNNLEKEIEFYKDILPSNLFPIADLPGGDLVCMDKEERKIYFWFHDMQGENLYLVANDFEQFIINFVINEVKKLDINTIKTKVFDDSWEAAFKKVAEKYKK